MISEISQPPEPISLRNAVVDDAEMLSRLSADTFYDTFAAQNTEENMRLHLAAWCPVPKIREELADPQSTFILAYAGKEVAGYAKVRRGPAPQGLTAKRFIEIERLYAVQKMIGTGIGKCLMTRCLEIANLENCQAIWLGVWEHNPRAIAFYKKFGFELFGSHVFMVGHDAQTDLMMVKYLKD